MPRVVYCVLLVLLLHVFEIICANEAAKGPFVIFQPAEFFDPFKETRFGDNQPSASVNVQPNFIFGEPNTIFSQPFKHLPGPNSLRAQPRAIGTTSGNAEDFIAQIWKANPFMANLPHAQPKSGTVELKAPVVQVNNLVPKVVPPKHELKLELDKVLDAKPKNAYHVVSPNNHKKIDTEPSSPRSQALKASPRVGHEVGTPYKNLDTQPSNLRSQALKASPRIGLEDNSIEQTGKQVAQSSEYPAFHAASKSSGGGHYHDAGHQKSHGDDEVKGYKSKHHHSTGDHGKHNDYHKESHNKEKGGNFKEHHDEASHYKKHHEGKKSHKAAKFGEKKGHKRGHKTRGYHNKFHRDEYHREHRFYDDYNKEGYHEKYGDSHSHYKNKEGGHKRGGSHKSGDSAKKHRKKGFSNKGHHVEENKGFDREGGRKKYHKHNSGHHKDQRKSKGKKYGYVQQG